MVVVVNFADEKFRPWQQLQTQTAYHFGADKVIEYSPADIDPEFYQKNKFILDQPRGAGYWLWKPYIILDALNKVDDGDIVFYLDSGAFFINRISYLTNTMDAEKVNIMVFGSDIGKTLERHWTKRDAFILMDCDRENFVDTPQIGATFFIAKKCTESIEFVGEWLKYIQDPRIVTDMPNQLGVENYEGFRENRHDQTVLSLLAKKWNLPIFRAPTQFAENFKLRLYHKKYFVEALIRKFFTIIGAPLALTGRLKISCAFTAGHRVCVRVFAARAFSLKKDSSKSRTNCCGGCLKSMATKIQKTGLAPGTTCWR